MKPDPITKLEAELAALRPGVPSEALKDRIDAQLRQAASTSRVVRKKSGRGSLNWFAWGWGIVAVLSIALVVSLWPETGRRAIFGAADYETPSSRIVRYQILSEQDDGVVLDDYGQPVRQVRYTAGETVRWRSPRTGANIQMSYPREETMLIPVAGN
ncbi:MAG TPA: hypothetical protein VIT91_11770 [Chthoniobacterales bacterium]